MRTFLVLIVLPLIALAVIGVIIGDVVGTFLFGNVVLGALAGGAFLPAVFTGRHHQRFAWGCLSAGAVIVVISNILARQSAEAMTDAETMLTLAMLWLTFPSGLVVPLLAFGLAGFDVSMRLNALSAAFLLFGALQWFVLAPAIQRWRSRRRAGS